MASCLCLEESLEVRQDPPEGPLVTLEGILRYRDVEDEVKGAPFKHRIAEIHAISMKRLSKAEAADDPSDGSRRGIAARFEVNEIEWSHPPFSVHRSYLLLQLGKIDPVLQ